MARLDERVRRDLERAARPADPAGVYEELIRRLERRRIIQRIQVAALAVAVLAGTLTGAYALSRAFLPGSAPASSPSVSTSPSMSPIPSAGGSDIGLPFRVCDVASLDGIDFLGDGTEGTAWTGARVLDNGTCPEPLAARHLVAIDYTGDGLADDAWDGLQDCIMCRPYAASDLDGDGDRELVVLAQASSTPQFLLFSLQPDPNGVMRLRPVTVAPPGHAPARLPAGEPLAILTGGDEGFTGAISCTGYPEDPVLIVAWANHPVEGPQSDVLEVHVTELVISREGAAHVVNARDFSQPVQDPLPPPFGSNDRACGIDFDPLR